MVNTPKKIIWSSSARAQLKQIHDFIKNDSVQAAEKVTKDIVAATRQLETQPTRYPLDKHRLKNDGTFRVFNLHRYMVSYQVTEESIIIVRIKHASMNDLAF